MGPDALAAIPLGKPIPSFWFKNAYEALVPCPSVPEAQCCSGVGHAFAQNATLYDGYQVKYNSPSFQLFSLDVTVRACLQLSCLLSCAVVGHRKCNAFRQLPGVPPVRRMHQMMSTLPGQLFCMRRHNCRAAQQGSASHCSPTAARH